MKIAMIGWEYPPFKVGGLGTHCYYLTRSLAKLGVKIDFFAPKVSKENRKSDLKNLRIIDVGETAIYPYGTETKTIDGDFFTAVEKFNKLCYEKVNGNYDLIHCHDWLTANAGIMLKEKLGIPLILTMHSTEYDRSANLNPNPWFIDIERNAMEKADRIIAVSHYTKRIIVERYGIDENKIRVVHNGVNPIGEHGEKKKIVLYLGRLTMQKGVEFFLRAAKKVLEKEDCSFVVAGSGDMLPQLIHLSIALGIADKVMFTGPLTEDEVKHIYRISSVYVLPSVSEPFGITALEAISAGTPVIISKSSGVAEALRNCLTADFWDVNEMANKIVALLRYDALRKTLKENAKKELRFLTWDRAARKTLEVYREVVS